MKIEMKVSSGPCSLPSSGPHFRRVLAVEMGGCEHLRCRDAEMRLCVAIFFAVCQYEVQKPFQICRGEGL